MNFIRVILKIQREVFSEALFKKKWVLYLGVAQIAAAFDLCHLCTLGHLFTHKQSLQASLCKNRQPVLFIREHPLFCNIHQKKCIRGVPLFRNTHSPLSPSSLYVCLCSGRGVLFSVMACCDTPLLSRMTRPALICLLLIITLTPIV